MSRDIEPDREEELSVQITVTKAWLGLWQIAYDALLNHGINFRNLKEYKDDALLDKAMEDGDIRRGQVHLLEYIKRLANGIKASIRRRGIRRVDDIDD